MYVIHPFVYRSNRDGHMERKKNLKWRQATIAEENKYFPPKK